MRFPHAHPRLQLKPPAGFSFRGIATPEDISAWISIWSEAHPGIDVGLARFHRAFGEDMTEIERRCWLLFDEKGNSIGTGAAWFDHDFEGGPAGRVHWLAVRPSQQGRGLGGVILSKILADLSRNYATTYLVTQADRLTAIRLYLSHGFRPLTVHQNDVRIWSQVLNQISHKVR